MLKYLTQLFLKTPEKFGILVALLGVLVLTPDTLVIRISALERWPLMGWRGLLMGIALLIWRTLLAKNPSSEWRSLFSWQGILVIIAFSMNSVTFTLGIVETSASVVLTLSRQCQFSQLRSRFLCLVRNKVGLDGLRFLLNVWCDYRSHGWK